MNNQRDIAKISAALASNSHKVIRFYGPNDFQIAVTVDGMRHWGPNNIYGVNWRHLSIMNLINCITDWKFGNRDIPPELAGFDDSYIIVCLWLKDYLGDHPERYEFEL